VAGLHPVALTSLLKEIAREEGGREVRRGEREYMSQREREGGRERERRSWVQGSERKRGDNGEQSESHGMLLFFEQCVGSVKGEGERKNVTDTNKKVNLLFPRRIFSSKT
jgi:hypothetical protein